MDVMHRTGAGLDMNEAVAVELAGVALQEIPLKELHRSPLNGAAAKAVVTLHQALARLRAAHLAAPTEARRQLPLASEADAQMEVVSIAAQ